MSIVFLSLALGALTGADAFKPSGDVRPVAKPYNPYFQDRYSPLKYLGPYGPYSTRSGNGISTDIPAGCEVDQVVLLNRHGERYAEPSDVKDQKAVIKKILKSLKPGHKLTGDLEFLNNWNFYLDYEGDAALEVEIGPYGGPAGMQTKGSTFRGRYGHLWDRESPVPLFVGGSERVIQSARAFGQGLFGYNYTQVAELNIIPETDVMGANSISPNYCAEEEMTQCNIPDKKTKKGLNSVIFPLFDNAAIRLNEQHGLNLNGGDVFNLLTIGAFDVMVRGDSPWLNVFTREEWTGYDYRMGTKFYCYSGEGSRISRANGMNWANATTTLLNQGPEGSGLPMVLNFGHDSDITSVLAGMGILKTLKPLDPQKITFGTRWDISDIVPMGASLIFERLKCKAPGLTNHTDLVNSKAAINETVLSNSTGEFNTTSGVTGGYFSPNATLTGFNLTNGTSNNKPAETSLFVRVLLNDAVVPLDECYGGPGFSCSLNDWNKLVANRTQENNFKKVCQPAAKGYPEDISFYWNYNHTTALDTAPYVPYQGLSYL